MASFTGVSLADTSHGVSITLPNVIPKVVSDNATTFKITTASVVNGGQYKGITSIVNNLGLTATVQTTQYFFPW